MNDIINFLDLEDENLVIPHFSDSFPLMLINGFNFGNLLKKS